METNGRQSAAEPAWAAFAAIDWADQKHFWRLVEAGSDRQECGELPQTPEAVDVWAMELHRRFGARPVAVCLEQKRGALITLLAKYPHLVLMTVHPQTAAAYRKTFCCSGAKSDPGDSASLLDLLLRHRDQLQAWEPDTVETRLLQLLVETRRRLVDERTRQCNRLTASLKIYFPQMLIWFDEVGSPLVQAVLDKWGTLQEMQRAHPGTLRRFFHEHNCRDEERIAERIQGIRDAMPATNDLAILEGEKLKAQALVDVIATLRRQIEIYDRRIAEVVASHPEADLFRSLPGVGPALLPRLIVAFGTRRERFASALDLQQFSGIAPVTFSSGKTCLIRMRMACPKFLRQTFHEFAAHSLQKSEWAKIYYQVQRDKDHQHHAAVRSLAYKWIRVVFRCWKDRRPYDERLYMRSLQQRNSPLAAHLLGATNAKWNNVAGFQKLSEDFS